ncbi:MAG: glycosyltransferase, partial [Alphaproteobacteria bacterium]
MTVAQLVETIAGSQEAATLREQAIARDKADADRVVRSLYEAALHRAPPEHQVQAWVDQCTHGGTTIAQVVETIAGSEEAIHLREQRNLVPEVPNGEFVQFSYLTALGRLPALSEVVTLDHQMRSGTVTRARLVLHLFAHRAIAQFLPDRLPTEHEPDVIAMMGWDRSLSVKEWKKKASEVSNHPEPCHGKAYEALRFDRQPRILVSAIASMYRGGDFIEQFLENITSQTIFSEHCELIIVDADSPENEFAMIERYMKRFPNIVYHRAATRIGIYEAWNVGVRMARGKYLTNANMDDLRRVDSFERQVEILEKFPFVDVTYQEFFYSFEGHAPFDFSAAVGAKSLLPVVTPYNLLASNSPHNAPMWRRALHDDVGMFDESYRSAGDHDFWLRCIVRNKVFYKCNDPHVVYFVNPEGLSTNANTHGVVEGQRTVKIHGEKIISKHLLGPDADFFLALKDASGVQLVADEADQDSAHWRYHATQAALRKYSAASRIRPLEEAHVLSH